MPARRPPVVHRALMTPRRSLCKLLPVCQPGDKYPTAPKENGLHTTVDG
jgi:hypothetical protein